MPFPHSSRAFVSPCTIAHSAWAGRTSLSRRCQPVPRRIRCVKPSRRCTTMLFESLAEKMTEVTRKMRGVDKITEKNVAGAMKNVKRALLDADVNLRVVNGLLKQIKTRAVGADVLPGIEPGQMLIKIMHEELTRIMGDAQAPIAKREDGNPTVVLLAGLQGAGKTTAAAKLALYLKKEKRSVMMIAADVYRPAAIEQLQTLGKMIEVDVFTIGTDANPRDIVRKGIQEAKDNSIDTVIVDTAGRQVIDTKLMKELKDIKTISQADETLLVVDAMTGQEAATLTKSFNEQVEITGAILTKMDGDTRGGAALSVQQVSGAPIKFIGVGEKVEKLEVFYPERMASRILGMGDVLSFVEKAQEQMDIADAEKMTKKMMEAKFDFNDFLKQTKMISSLGSFGGVMKMLPGMSGQISSSKMAQAENKMKVADSLIKSMTHKERGEPEVLFTGKTAKSRLRRIALGSGRKVEEAESLVNDFRKMRTMMQRMSNQMIGGQGNAGPDGEQGMPAMPAMNRSQRRKSGKKKSGKTTSKRGFG